MNRFVHTILFVIFFMSPIKYWLFFPNPAFAQNTPQRPFKIFMVLWRGQTPVEIGFKNYLAEQGIPINYIIRNLDQQTTRLPEVILEIKRESPDLVYTWGTSVTLGVVGPYDAPPSENFIHNIPVLFTMAADPIGAKLVPSFESSNRNLTGTSHMAPLSVQLKAMGAYRPFQRIGHIYNPAERQSVLVANELESVAKQQGFDVIIKTIPLDASNKPQAKFIPELVEELAKERIEYIYLGPDSFLAVHRNILVNTALKEKIPVFCSTEFPLRESRPLMGLVSSYQNLGAFTAFKARQILVEGRQARDIPVETLKRFSFVINMGVAKQLGFFPPITVLKYAEIITE
ncbi:putative ABC transport system substrate-binding protein [Azospirillaceae bacterium]